MVIGLQTFLQLYEIPRFFVSHEFHKAVKSLKANSIFTFTILCLVSTQMSMSLSPHITVKGFSSASVHQISLQQISYIVCLCVQHNS